MRARGARLGDRSVRERLDLRLHRGELDALLGAVTLENDPRGTSPPKSFRISASATPHVSRSLNVVMPSPCGLWQSSLDQWCPTGSRGDSEAGDASGAITGTAAVVVVATATGAVIVAGATAAAVPLAAAAVVAVGTVLTAQSLEIRDQLGAQAALHMQDCDRRRWQPCRFRRFERQPHVPGYE